MKEKNKNILKGLGIGALACVGMFGLTGCSNINQKQIDSLMSTVEKLEKRLDKQNKNLTNEESYKIYRTALNNLYLNTNGEWGNLRITMTEGEDEYVSEFCKTSQGVKAFVSYEPEGWYATISNGEDQTIDASYLNKIGGDPTESKEIIDSSFEDVIFEGEESSMLWDSMRFTEGDVVSGEVNENGNYEIVLVKDVQREYEYESQKMIDKELIQLQVEINKDGKVLNQTLIEMTYESDRGEIYSPEVATIKYEYGVVQESDILEIIEQVNNLD